MIISEDQLKKFQELYQTEFGEEISRENAFEQAMKLVSFFLLTHTTMTKEEFAQYQKD